MTAEHNSTTVPRGKRMAAALSGLVAFMILIGLGVWQSERLVWKENLLATIDARTHSAPIPLADALATGKPVDAMEYQPVTLSGVFDHQYERHFFATYDGASGFYVYTPLRQADGDWVFVNRGFVPYELKDPAKRAEGQVAGAVTVTGLLRPILAGKPSFIVPDNEPDKNMFYWKDFGAMRASSGLPQGDRVLELFVDADKTPNPGGLPVGGVTIIDLPNNHLQYAMTWFGLAAALAAVLGTWLWRARQARDA